MKTVISNKYIIFVLMSPALKQLLEKLFLNSRTLSVSPAVEIKKKFFSVILHICLIHLLLISYYYNDDILREIIKILHDKMLKPIDVY